MTTSFIDYHITTFKLICTPFTDPLAMDDYYCVQDSDNERYDSSSDDELFTSLLNLNQTKYEDFEKEMESERDHHLNGVHNNHSQQQQQPISNEEPIGTTDSTNDDLFYDPESDERDQQWIDSQRGAVLCSTSTSRSQSSQSRQSSRCGTASDAVLNCPCCMCLLCLDCQRHEIYKTQYRAMFVFNCKIDFSKQLQYRNKKRKRASNERNGPEIDLYYAVKCAVCNTEVAVYDTQQVYHFFSVLSSFT